MSACLRSMRLSTRELLCTCCHTMKSSHKCRCQMRSAACCCTAPEALPPMLCRFLSNNKVYPDDVIVIESGINDILVRPAVCLSDYERRDTMERTSTLCAAAVSRCSRTLQPCRIARCFPVIALK